MEISLIDDLASNVTLAESMATELTDAELDAVSGAGRWIDMTDDGRQCDGRVWVY